MSTDLEPQALTAEEVEAEREDHRPTVSSPDGTFCGECDYQWPCPMARLLATLDAARSQPVTSDLVAAALDLHKCAITSTRRRPCDARCADAIRAALSASESTPLAVEREPLDERALAIAMHETATLSHRTRFHFVGDGDERGSCACQVDAAELAAEYRRLSGETP